MTLQKGSCLCKAVKLEVELDQNNVGFCHCEICRKNGAAFFLIQPQKPDVVKTGHANITCFNTSENGSRYFCKTCGTSLYYKHEDTGQISIMAAILDDQAAFEFTLQLYTDHKPNHFNFVETTKEMTKQDLA